MTVILFVCVENAGRSQMAEAFFRRYAQESFDVRSMGTRPASEINPVAVQAMAEVGIKLSGLPKLLTSQDILHADKIISMGCMDDESCPSLTNNEDWNIPDPSGKSLEQVRAIRTLIESKVRALIRQLDEK